MSELQLLILVMAVIYGWECLNWLPRGTVAFLIRSGGHWRLAHPAALLGNQTVGIVLADPLPPLGTFLTASQSPVSFSPEEGVYSYVAQCVSPGWRPAQSGQYFAFAAIKTIDVSGKLVLVNGVRLLKAGSPYQAEHIAGQLRKLLKLDAGARKGAIKEMFRDSLDLKAIGERLKAFNLRAPHLRWLCNLMFVFLFALAPAWIWWIGFRRGWIELAVTVLTLTTTTAILFQRAHREFYPAADDDRLTHFCLILLAPATAARAHDALARPLLEKFHPLAAARVLLPAEKFNEFARRVVLELRHPCLPVCPTDDPAAHATEANARAGLTEAVERFLQQQGVPIADLLRPPEPTDATCQSYCPRCEAQFTALEGVCADCGGLPLIRFIEAKPAVGDAKSSSSPSRGPKK